MSSDPFDSAEFAAGFELARSRFPGLPLFEAVDLLPLRVDADAAASQTAAGASEDYAAGFGFGAWLGKLLATAPDRMTPGTPSEPGAFILSTPEGLGFVRIDEARP